MSLLRCPAFGGSLHAFSHVREAIDRTPRTEDEQVQQKLTEVSEPTVLPVPENETGVWVRIQQKPAFTGNRQSRRRQEAQWRRGATS